MYFLPGLPSGFDLRNFAVDSEIVAEACQTSRTARNEMRTERKDLTSANFAKFEAGFDLGFSYQRRSSTADRSRLRDFTSFRDGS